MILTFSSGLTVTVLPFEILAQILDAVCLEANIIRYWLLGGVLGVILTLNFC